MNWMIKFALEIISLKINHKIKILKVIT